MIYPMRDIYTFWWIFPFHSKNLCILNSENKDVDKKHRERERPPSIYWPSISKRNGCVLACVYELFFSCHENNFALFSQKKNNKHRNFKIHGRCNAYSWLWLWSQVPRVLFSATNGDSYQTMHRFLQNQSNKCITLYVTKAASSITICTYTYVYVSRDVRVSLTSFCFDFYFHFFYCPF